MARSKSAGTNGNSTTAANLGFEAKLWAAADALRNNMDAAEYKHVVLGLIFLKYISASSKRRKPRAPTPKTATSTALPASSGCRRKRAGRT